MTEVFSLLDIFHYHQNYHGRLVKTFHIKIEGKYRQAEREGSRYGSGFGKFVINRVSAVCKLKLDNY